MGIIDREDSVLARMRSPLPTMSDEALDVMTQSAAHRRATGRSIAVADSGNSGLRWVAIVMVVVTALAYVAWLVMR